MTTNSSNVKKVEITEAEMLELRRARERAAKQAEYRAARNQRPDVKMKNAEYHEKRAMRLKAYDAAYRFMVENDLITKEVQDRLLQEVSELADYIEMYESVA